MEDRKKRKQWTTSTDHDLYDGLKNLSSTTRIAASISKIQYNSERR